MERLTRRAASGRAVFNMRGAPIEQAMMLPAIMERLAAYEDTGLEPEEVAKVRDAYSSIAGKGVSGSRIQELIRAEREGRLVVLPCKIGDTVYLVTNGGIKKTEVESIHQWTSGHWKLSTHTDRMSAYWTGYEIDFRGIGKTVFLTSEEAEAALKKGETNET